MATRGQIGRIAQRIDALVTPFSWLPINSCRDLTVLRESRTPDSGRCIPAPCLNLATTHKPAVYASRVMLPSPMQDSLPAGWLASTGRESNPLDRGERFPSFLHLFPLSWIYPDATLQRLCPVVEGLLPCTEI